MAVQAVCGGDGRPGCGAPIVLVPLVDLDRPVPADQRSWVPLDLAYDPQSAPVPPSHATNLARPPSQCRVLARGEAPMPDERPALIHFAICPHRTGELVPTEGP